ncbi:MAG: response regulator transcription factor [Xanthobacteraceae bacterium]
MNTETRDIALVVDDSPETLRMLTDALDAAGMTVMVALDGNAAIRIAQQIRPNIVLLDAIMPGIDGFETCRRLKRETSVANAPVIFMTGLSETEHIVKGLEAGGVDYVTKPIAIPEMLARIRVHLANARIANSTRAALDAAERYLFAVNVKGELLWATPEAQRLLDAQQTTLEQDLIVLPAQQMEWVFKSEQSQVAPLFTDWQIQGNKLHLNYLGKLAPSEFLLRLTIEAKSTAASDHLKELGLTVRETEVLSWLSKGKTNRDIAQILGLSPRTIDKHLEQIYAKLGVENRTAAATIAVRIARRE